MPSRTTERSTLRPSGRGPVAQSSERELGRRIDQLSPESQADLEQLVEVLKAAKRGDLSVRFEYDRDGLFSRAGELLNEIIGFSEHMATELVRVSQVVGHEGRMHERASAGAARGAWASGMESVNQLISDLVAPTNEVARVITAVARGDLSQKMVLEIEGRPVRGEFLRIGTTVNSMVDQLNSFAAEVTRVAKEVGNEGKLGGQADVKGVYGTWKDLTDNVNGLAANLTTQVRNIAKVTTAVARGDLSQKITVDARGEILELKSTINTMVDTLNSFAAEVTRVAKEVGTEGKLGGQAEVRGVSGTWKDLTDNVNVMAGNLTKQVRGIVRVVTAVANGDLSRKFVIEAKGEVAALAETINDMTDTLRIFADQVTTVAREVGIEGKLGGQAKVPGAAGTWRDLTDNVNQLAGNLTSQVRAIGEVSTAVAKGDLTRTVTVAAQGEVAVLKDNVNQMIANLKDTTRQNQEQDWLKTNVARFSGMLQGQRDIVAVAKLVMSELTPLVDAQHGAFFMLNTDSDGEALLQLVASYGLGGHGKLSNTYRLRETLIGQSAFEKRRILLSDVPENFITIASGMGEAPPRSVVVLPVLFEGETKAVIELASFKHFVPNHLNFLDQLMSSVGVTLNMISSNMRTEELLSQLKKSNAELEAQAAELNDKARLLEFKNSEVELASRNLEEKAEQLQLISRYKSEFLANMSHELRTPLNSLLILAQVLAENRDGNLTPEQVKFAQTVHTSGNELLSLINEILDLSKVEAGKMPIVPKAFTLKEVERYLGRNFQHIADQKGLRFEVRLDHELPPFLHTDAARLQQILKNLLSNAFKFTSRGGVEVRISSPDGGESVSFSVTDSGIGIPLEKQKLIFEAFQQADGTTSRKYGGTGLGLTISREIARLLGGSIEVESLPGSGSTFTLVIPVAYAGPDSGPRDEMSASFIRSVGAPPADDADFSGMRVLLVDDDARNVFAILTVLEARGIQVLHAANGKLALELLRSNPDLDLVLMDTMMPEMDGLTAMRAIREILGMRELPIISLTAQAMAGDREKAIEAGATDYVTKPVDPQTLLGVIHTWRRPRKEGAASRSRGQS